MRIKMRIHRDGSRSIVSITRPVQQPKKRQEPKKDWGDNPYVFGKPLPKK